MNKFIEKDVKVCCSHCKGSGSCFDWHSKGRDESDCRHSGGRGWVKDSIEVLDERSTMEKSTLTFDEWFEMLPDPSQEERDEALDVNIRPEELWELYE